jgi:hypothetical protein
MAKALEGFLVNTGANYRFCAIYGVYRSNITAIQKRVHFTLFGGARLFEMIEGA